MRHVEERYKKKKSGKNGVLLSLSAKVWKEKILIEVKIYTRTSARVAVRVRMIFRAVFPPFIFNEFRVYYSLLSFRMNIFVGSNACALTN